MNKINSIAAMYMMAAMSVGNELGSNNRERYIEPKETEEKRKKRLAEAEIKRYNSQGLSEFIYGKNSLWALNKSSADRKARKRHWL